MPIFTLALFVAGSAYGQRLLHLGAAFDEVLESEDGLVAFGVEIDADLVRSAPDLLELPTPDGRLLVAELRVFEDRGGGDVMWAGGFPEAGYESVVITVKDDHLAGRFGEPGGAKYLITAGPDGQGRMVDTSVRVFDAEDQHCPGGVLPPEAPVASVPQAQQAGAPRSAASESNHDVLDILAIYTSEAEERWGRRSTTPAAAIQQSVDYLGTVFRNGQIGVTPNLVHFEQAPAAINDHEPADPINDDLPSCGHMLSHLRTDPDVARLRAEHKADVVHLFFWGADGCSGIAYLLQRGVTAQGFSGSAFGLTIPRSEYDSTFAHEVGHNMGANHDPQNTNDYDNRRANTAVEPYAFGHTDFLPIPNIDTIMSYGSGRVEPYFSTVRISPRGWTLGIADERENERAMQRTVNLAVRYGDELGSGPGGGPAAPVNLSVATTGASSVRLTWVDDSDNETGFELQHRLYGAAAWMTRALPANVTSAVVTDLEPGGRYEFRVFALNEEGRNGSDVVTVVLPTADYTDCVPSTAQIVFDHGYMVSMCVEYEENGETVQRDALDYELASRESGLLYFFDRDNAEVLVKVLDACVVNGHRWVFVAPVTTLAFNLYVDEVATGQRWVHRHTRAGGSAATKSDTSAFPCTDSVPASQVGLDVVAASDWATRAAPGPFVSKAMRKGAPDALSPSLDVLRQPIEAGQGTDCEPQEVLTLKGGFKVSMCYDTGDAVGEAFDWGLDSEQSGLLYFFDRNNAEVLIKVLDACVINNHRWVFVAPVTDLAFNLVVESPDGERWTHENVLRRTAAPKSSVTAFSCSG